jgi:NAD(P)H dehydrogenase (quinone)
MVKVAVVYHSETGNTERMARMVVEGAEGIEGAEAKMMPVTDLDEDYLAEAGAVILGSPTYEGSCTWQMKRFIDTVPVNVGGKLGGVFATQNWPGGGGASFAEMTMIAGMLVRGMLVYSGGITEGTPYLHFGAVSEKAPEGLYAERAVKLGRNIASKAVELFGNARS